MGKLAFGLTLALSSALLYFLLTRQPAPIVDKQAATIPAPLALSLTWLRALPEEESAVVVRILDRAAQKRPPSYQPAVVRFAPETWLQRIRFYAVDAHGNTRALNPELQLVEASPDIATPLEASKKLRAVLRLQDLQRETRYQWLRAEMEWQGWKVQSNRAYPGPTPEDEAARWRVRAQIALLLKNAALMEQAAAAMQGTPLARHFYQGLAHELRGQSAQALQAYRQAMKRWHEKPGEEPPTQLLQRIRHLEQTTP